MQMPPKKSPDLIESHACEIVNIDLKFQPERCSPDDGQLSADAGNVDFLFFSAMNLPSLLLLNNRIHKTHIRLMCTVPINNRRRAP